MNQEAQRRVIRLNLVYAWVFAALTFLQASIQFLLGNLGPGALLLALAVLLVASTYALARRMVARSRIVYGDGTYTYLTTFRTIRFTVAEVERVVTVNRMAHFAGPLTHHLVVVGPNARLLYLVGQMWSADQLSAIALDLTHRGAPMTSLHDPITPVQLRKLDKRYMSAVQAHPLACAILVVVGALIVIAIVATIIIRSILGL